MANTYKSVVTAVCSAWAALCALFLLEPPTYLRGLAFEALAFIGLLLFIFGALACVRSTVFRADRHARFATAFATLPIVTCLILSARFYLTS